MYQRYCHGKGFKIKELSRMTGEAGIKSLVMEIRGSYAYGWLKGENGVHRLVRISPFSAKGLRHTSFALVEVLPEIKKSKVEIKESDLKIETFRASSAGGQYVNKRESAVRITHLPTKISVACQVERSQGENKEKALAVLKAKLEIMREKEKEEKIEKERGELPLAEWGNQIRSYVFQPYQMVKDHRTGFKTSQLNKILDGDLDKIIEAENRG